jgi:hypothetical protein
VRRIFSDYEGYENQPEYSVSDNGVIATLYNRNYKNIGKNVTNKKALELRRERVIELMLQDSQITISQLSEKLNVSTRIKNPYIYL